MTIHAFRKSESSKTHNQLVIQEALDKGAEFEENNVPNDAIAVYQQLLGKFPKCEEAITRISLIFIRHCELENAIKSLRYHLTIADKKEVVHFNLAVAYASAKKPDKAYEHYKKAIETEPSYIEPYFPLVKTAKVLAKMDDVKELVFEGLKHVPDKFTQYWMKGKFAIEQKDFDYAKTLFSAAQEAGSIKDQRAYFCTDFANLENKLGHYNRAYDLHKKAQNLYSKRDDAQNISTSFYDDIVKKSRAWFTGQNIKNWEKKTFKGLNSPIFVVGFPRSGTTLVEQMLYAHPNLAVTEESPMFIRGIKHMTSIVGRQIPFPNGYKSLSKAEIKTWQTSYFKNIKTEIAETEQHLRIVDKNPMTIRQLGSVNRFFPQSPVLVMIRDPRDVCLSCFFQSFKPNVTTINFYDLASTFRLYAETMSLYLEFRESLSLNILEVKYEEMCQDIEGYARKIASHINEPFNDNMINYHDAQFKRVVRTPSFEGVAQPIYSKAIGNWRNYEKYIKPLEPIIEPYLKAFGYK